MPKRKKLGPMMNVQIPLVTKRNIKNNWNPVPNRRTSRSHQKQPTHTLHQNLTQHQAPNLPQILHSLLTQTNTLFNSITTFSQKELTSPGLFISILTNTIIPAELTTNFPVPVPPSRTLLLIELLGQTLPQNQDNDNPHLSPEQAAEFKQYCQ